MSIIKLWQHFLQISHRLSIFLYADAKLGRKLGGFFIAHGWRFKKIRMCFYNTQLIMTIVVEANMIT